MQADNKVEEFGRLDCRGMKLQDALNHIASVVYLHDDAVFQLLVTGDASSFEQGLVKWCTDVEIQIVRLRVVNQVVHAVLLSNPCGQPDFADQDSETKAALDARSSTLELPRKETGEVALSPGNVTQARPGPVRKRLNTANVLQQMVSMADELDALDDPEAPGFPHEDPLLEMGTGLPEFADPVEESSPRRATILDRNGSAAQLLLDELDGCLMDTSEDGSLVHRVQTRRMSEEELKRYRNVSGAGQPRLTAIDREHPLLEED